MLYYRPHRGALEDSIKELRKFETFTQLVQHLREDLKPYNFTFMDADVSIVPYVSEHDRRIGWPDTLIVRIKNYGVMGFVTHKNA